MFFAIVDAGQPQELEPGRPFVSGDTQHPWAVTQIWSAADLKSIGVYPITETDIPAGKVSVGSSLTFAKGVVTRKHVLADKPAEPAPDGPTLSDWRVALVVMGRFDDVLEKITAARDSGSVEGAIAWQRFEYANNVYRAELLKLAPVMGFTTEDVEQSLTIAAQVSRGG
jgi:hypothetical protein